MKVKFLQDYKGFCRGMQYEIEQVGKELAEQLEQKEIAFIVPLPLPETEPDLKAEPVQEIKQAVKSPVKSKRTK